MVSANLAALHSPETLLPSIDWEEVDCPLCGSARYETVLEAPDHSTGGGLRFAVVRCTQCGLRFTNPRPNIECITPFYPSDYPPHQAGPRVERSRRLHWHPMAALTGRPCPERRYLPWHGQGRLLDFGCGAGAYLRRMRQQGWNVLGLDVSSEVVAEVRSLHGLPVHVGTLPHPAVAPASFDVVSMWCSLEHVHSPLETLRQAFRVLVPGGRLYVAVPNFDCRASSLFGEHWYGLDLPRHLTHFSPTTLKQMLEVAGFRISYERGVSHPEWIRQSARIARGAKADLLKQAMTFKTISRLLSLGSYLTGRAECIMILAERPD